METKKVWLVTGASKGLGLALVKLLLARGVRVAATSRNLKGLGEAVGAVDANFLPLQMDLVNEDSVSEGINAVIAKFGVIDVVVNNAGYGQAGTLEELSDQEARQNFDVNVFAVLNVVRQVMPYLRTQKSGHIFNISSVGGFIANFPGFGVYCATKYAVAGLTEALAAEIKPFGVRATVVYPGYFRTNFLDEGSFSLPKKPMAAYEIARALEKVHIEEIRGNQAGDPGKAAAVMMEIAQQEQPPLHLFMGRDAYQYAEQKIEVINSELATHKALATATDY